MIVIIYIYCNNNPVMYQDDEGESVIFSLFISALIGAIIGGISSGITGAKNVGI